VQPLLTRENDDAAIDGDTRSISDTFGDDIDKRVIHEIDTQLKEIHAINNYGKVKDERDLLEKKLNHVLILHKETSDEIKKLTEGMKGYIETLDKLSRAEEEIAKLRQRIGELEQLKFILPEEGSNKTNNINSGGAATTDDKPGTKKLLEVEKMFLNSKEEEIKKRAAELFNSKREGWEKTEKPRLVSEAAAQALQQMIEKLSRRNDDRSSTPSPATSPSTPILPRELQERLNSIIQVEVQRRVESGFIEPKAEELRQEISDNVFAFLQGPWDVPCRICRGMHTGMWLSYGEIASLVRDDDLVLECVENHNLIRPVTDLSDKVIGLLSQRRFKLTLADLISLKLSSDE
jgi:hypothetical protein